MNPRRTLLALVAAFAVALCLSACDDEPSLSEFKQFRAYPVYYPGESVDGHSLREVLGDPTQYGDKRDTTWILIYGRCQDRPDEGGCPYPVQVHNYSTCTRWATQLDRNPRQLFDFRGAKAIRLFQGGGAGWEIFTGRTTVTISAEDQQLLHTTARALRTVDQEHPSPLPPPAPGSLQGKLPCQGRSG